MLSKYEEAIRTTDKMLFSLTLWDTEYFSRERSIVEVVSLSRIFLKESRAYVTVPR